MVNVIIQGIDGTVVEDMGGAIFGGVNSTIIDIIKGTGCINGIIIGVIDSYIVGGIYGVIVGGIKDFIVLVVGCGNGAISGCVDGAVI